MDWHSLCSAFAARTDEALFVLDPEGVVRLASAEIESLFGATRGELAGRHASTLFGPRKDAEELRQLLRVGVSQRTRVLRQRLTAEDGRSFLVDLEVEPLATGAGLLVRILRLETPAPSLLSGSGTVVYEISVAGEDPGNLLRVHWPEASPSEFRGSRCYETILGRSTPCPGCPVIVPGAELPLASAIPMECGATLLLRAAGGEPGTALVAATFVDDSTRRSLLEAKVQALGAERGLSARESAVLRQLVQGKALAEIAAHLRISVRTVKFHQANLLAKLGAASRIDLLRLFW